MTSPKRPEMLRPYVSRSVSSPHHGVFSSVQWSHKGSIGLLYSSSRFSEPTCVKRGAKRSSRRTQTDTIRLSVMDQRHTWAFYSLSVTRRHPLALLTDCGNNVFHRGDGRAHCNGGAYHRVEPKQVLGIARVIGPRTRLVFV